MFTGTYVCKLCLQAHMYVNTYIDTHTINLQSFNSLGHESFHRSSKSGIKFGEAAPIGLPIRLDVDVFDAKCGVHIRVRGWLKIACGMYKFQEQVIQK